MLLNVSILSTWKVCIAHVRIYSWLEIVSLVQISSHYGFISYCCSPSYCSQCHNYKVGEAEVYASSSVFSCPAECNIKLKLMVNKMVAPPHQLRAGYALNYSYKIPSHALVTFMESETLILSFSC